jgi:hypothetical protein
VKIDGLTIAIGLGIVALLLLGGGVSDEEIDNTAKVAMAKETDPDVLTAFATKLRNAGRYQQADMLDARAAYITGATQQQTEERLQQTVAPVQEGGPILAIQPSPPPPPQPAPILQTTQQFMMV